MFADSHAVLSHIGFVNRLYCRYQIPGQDHRTEVPA